MSRSSIILSYASVCFPIENNFLIINKTASLGEMLVSWALDICLVEAPADLGRKLRRNEDRALQIAEVK
jgi:hypothetical protein